MLFCSSSKDVSKRILNVKSTNRLLTCWFNTALNLLAVSPKFQRRGVGALLVQYGLDIADRDGIESYLESTKPGYNLYKRSGFEDHSMINLEIGKWTDVEGEILPFPVMIRPAQGKGNLRN